MHRNANDHFKAQTGEVLRQLGYVLDQIVSFGVVLKWIGFKFNLSKPEPIHC